MSTAFARAQSNWDNAEPRDDSALENAIERAADAIEADHDALIEAVIFSCEADLRLAELRIMLHNASSGINQLFNGKTLDEVMAYPANLDAMRALLRAANEADSYVAEKITQAATDEAMR